MAHCTLPPTPATLERNQYNDVILRFKKVYFPKIFYEMSIVYNYTFGNNRVNNMTMYDKHFSRRLKKYYLSLHEDFKILDKMEGVKSCCGIMGVCYYIQLRSIEIEDNWDIERNLKVFGLFPCKTFS